MFKNQNELGSLSLSAVWSQEFLLNEKSHSWIFCFISLSKTVFFFLPYWSFSVMVYLGFEVEMNFWKNNHSNDEM